MNPLFKLPLHGVACVPFCGTKQHELPLEITLGFSGFTRDKTLKPIWSMIDEGERYHSEVNLYKASSHENVSVSERATSASVGSNKSINDSYYLTVNCQGKGFI